MKIRGNIKFLLCFFCLNASLLGGINKDFQKDVFIGKDGIPTFKIPDSVPPFSKKDLPKPKPKTKPKKKETPTPPKNKDSERNDNPDKQDLFADTIDDSADVSGSIHAASIENAIVNGGVSSSTPNEYKSDFNLKFVKTSHTGFTFGLKSNFSHNNQNKGLNSRIEDLIHSTENTAPVNIFLKQEKDDTLRVWVSPFVSYVNNVGARASKFSSSGFITGGQYNNIEQKYSVALFLGAHSGKKTSKTSKIENDKLTGFLLGGQLSWKPWEGGKLEFFHIRSRDNHNQSKDINNNEVQAKYKAIGNTIDIQLSHKVKIIDNKWSVRANLGHSYDHRVREAYQEHKGRGLNIPEAKNRSYELFGGLGLRYIEQLKDWRFKITNVYEYGYEYKRSSSNTPLYKSTSINPVGFTTSEDLKNKRKTHYLTTYITANNKDGLKVLLGYFASIRKNTVGSTVSAKIEYRW